MLLCQTKWFQFLHSTIRKKESKNDRAEGDWKGKYHYT